MKEGKVRVIRKRQRVNIDGYTDTHNSTLVEKYRKNWGWLFEIQTIEGPYDFKYVDDGNGVDVCWTNKSIRLNYSELYVLFDAIFFQESIKKNKYRPERIITTVKRKKNNG